MVWFGDQTSSSALFNYGEFCPAFKDDRTETLFDCYSKDLIQMTVFIILIIKQDHGSIGRRDCFSFMQINKMLTLMWILSQSSGQKVKLFDFTVCELIPSLSNAFQSRQF